MVLLDSDVVIDVVREYPPAMAWMASLQDEEIVLPGFVVMELIQGCGSKVEQREVREELAPYEVGWPTPEMCDQALEVFADFRLSHGLGILDALIAQMAVGSNVPLHTFNQKHYAAIPGLMTVQPYLRTLA